MKMKIGLSWFFIKPMPFEREVLLHYAKEADRLGFESLWIPEHAAIPHGYKTHYPYSVDGKLPTNDEEMPFPDPFITLAFAAGVTNKIKFGTNIAILPQRHPLYAAKELATLDVLSKGRVILGIGSGWLKEEFDALGIDYHKRGVRTDECIQALRTLWRDDPASFDGKQIKFGPMRSFPKPFQKGGIPIHVGGISDAAIRRTARYGDGYLPVPVEDLAGLFKKVRDECTKIGRNPDEIEFSCPAQPTMEGVKQAQDLGAKRVTTGIYFSRDLDQVTRDLEKIANDVLVKL
jgi:probable F420-dependent oxidoreductase